jgi:hypothetical protein
LKENAWFHPLNLWSAKLVSSLCSYNFDLYHYKEGAGEGDNNKTGGVQALAGATKEQAAAAAANGLDRADNAAADANANNAPLPDDADEPKPDTGDLRAVDDAMEVEPNADGTATAEGEGLDGDDKKEAGEGEGEGEEDTADPNAGKTAEERGAAKKRKKGANVDESKAKGKPKGAGAGAAGANEDGDDAEAAENPGEKAEGEMVPGGRADIGEETRVTLQMLEDASLVGLYKLNAVDP